MPGWGRCYKKSASQYGSVNKFNICEISQESWWKIKNLADVGWGRIEPDSISVLQPAAPGSIPGFPELFSEKKLSMLHKLINGSAA